MQRNYIPILAFGVFGILNTGMGIIGVLPILATRYHISLQEAGLAVSLFALAIALSGPILPMVCSRFNRKKLMVGILALFTLGNLVAAETSNFTIFLVARTLPAFFYPVYVSLALTAAAETATTPSEAPQKVAKIIVGVSVGMVMGAPMAALLANIFSLTVSLYFFAFINLLGLLGTFLGVPHFAVSQAISYGQQLGILKQKKLWLAFVGVIFMNGAVFGVYSYMAAYLELLLGVTPKLISAILLGYGLLNIVGNVVAGKYLSAKPNWVLLAQPLLLLLLYLILLGAGSHMGLVILVVGLLGIVAGMVASSIQYWVVTEGNKAPEVANGLYLTAANLGVTLATSFCGLFITHLGIGAVLWGGLIFSLYCLFCVGLKIWVLDK